MKLAFCLFNYFPYGGLQRDFLRIAKLCIEKGHEVEAFTMKWEGSKPDWLKVNFVPQKGLSNHRRALNFSKQVKKLLSKQQFDKVVGFNKMPGLDIYYAADGCFVAKPQYQDRALKFLNPRYRVYKKLEKSVFNVKSKTKILLLSEKEKKKYQKAYNTPDSQITLLPPGISKTCIPPTNANDLRKELRDSLYIKDQEFMLLCIASSFNTKGVDRAIKAFCALPEEKLQQSKLVIVGKDDPEQYNKLYREHKDRIIFLGARDDIPNLLFSADLLLHFARVDNTGTVILEAVVAGLPVLATNCCGYTTYVKEAKAGKGVRSTPFTQAEVNALLDKSLDKEKLQIWHQNCLQYSSEHDLFSLFEKAVTAITNT
jgi:UDP-glucose:(heptosyl)LPS alpha-1,3-glucosyltransferase